MAAVYPAGPEPIMTTFSTPSCVVLGASLPLARSDGKEKCLGACCCCCCLRWKEKEEQGDDEDEEEAAAGDDEE